MMERRTNRAGDATSNIQHPTPKAQVGADTGGKSKAAVSPSRRQTGPVDRGKYDLEERLTDFACLIIDTVESLPPTRAGNHVGGQLVRCGTSPAANYGEAQSAESRSDFVHKLKIVLKELRESNVWLEVIRRRSMAPEPTLVLTALAECGELRAIFHRSIATAKENMRRRSNE